MMMNENIITMTKEKLLSIMVASIRAGCAYTLITEKMMDSYHAINMAKDFLQDTIELENEVNDDVRS